MCWKCENPDGAEEDYLDQLREMMRDHHGWQVQIVEHDRRPFAYTVGLHNRGLPELLITGLNAHVSNRVLKSIGHMIVDDGTFLAPAMQIDYPGQVPHGGRRGRSPRRAPEGRRQDLRPGGARPTTRVGRRPRPVAMGARVGSRSTQAAGVRRPHPSSGMTPNPSAPHRPRGAPQRPLRRRPRGPPPRRSPSRGRLRDRQGSAAPATRRAAGR
jgi:hypothetical protein